MKVGEADRGEQTCVASDDGVQKMGTVTVLCFLNPVAFYRPLDLWVTFGFNDLPVLVSLKIVPNSQDGRLVCITIIF